MTYPTWWNPARVAEVFTTESRQKARSLFLATHRPFRRIRVDFCKDRDTGRDFIGEEELREIVQDGTLNADNRLFFVAGEAGSGKSELCQWLEYTADTIRRVPVHIPRSLTTAAHVAARLRQQLGRAATGSIPLRRAPGVTLSRLAALSAVVLLYERGAAALEPAHAWEPLLASDDIVSEVAAYLEGSRRGERAVSLLPTDRVRQLCARHGIALDPVHSAHAAQALRDLLTHALDQTIWLGDLRELLRYLSAQAIRSGRRPLLLIEDITAFQVVGDLLLDYLLDLTSGHYDAVIGLTTGFERTQLAHASLAGDLTHIHHRLRGRFVLTDEQGRAYGLEEDLIGFAGTYLHSVSSDGIEAPIGMRVPAAFQNGLYPFTETALHRAFACLEEEGNPRQTPRLVIEHVLGAVLLGREIPPVVLDRSPYLRRPPLLFRRDDVGDDTLVSLLRWYGKIGEREVTLDRGIADFWGVPVPEGLCQNGVIRVARIYTIQEVEPAEIAAWHQHVRELQHWLDTGGLYPSREILKRGIERVLLCLGDPRELGSPDSLSLTRAELYYARGDERLPIYLGGNSGDVLGRETSIKVEVTRAPEERGILEELAHLSLSGGKLSQVCQNLASTLDWAQRHWDSYHDQIRSVLVERLGGMTAEELIWVTWRLVASACGAPWGVTPHLRARVTDAPTYAESSPWDPAAHHVCYVAGEELAKWHETIRRLFIGMFTLRDSLLDLQRCESMASGLDATVALERLAKLPLRALRAAPFKIRPGGQSLYDLLVPVQRYAKALIDLELEGSLRTDRALLSRLAAHLQAQEDTDLDILQGHLQALRWRCAEFGVAWQRTWDASLQALTSLTMDKVHVLSRNVAAAVAECELLVTPSRLDIWSYLDFRYRLRPLLCQPYWEATSTLERILVELLRAGQQRYQHGGRTLTDTTIYREVVGAVRVLREELRHG